jgi:hypothetical protein
MRSSSESYFAVDFARTHQRRASGELALVYVRDAGVGDIGSSISEQDRRDSGVGAGRRSHQKLIPKSIEVYYRAVFSFSKSIDMRSMVKEGIKWRTNWPVLY